MIQSHPRSKGLLILVIALVLAVKGFAQTTIVNYNFNEGTSYGTLNPALAGSITCSANSSETFTTGTGISSGSSAFTSNATAGNAVGMTNSSGTDTRYFLFQLGGSDLATYISYKLYLQAKAASTGATTLKVSYSTDGSTYTTFGTTQSSAVGSYRECLFDLSSVVALNQQASVYFKITASGASGTGALAIDNFEIQAARNPTCSPTLSITNTPTLTCSSPSGVITTSTTASGLNYLWSPGTYTVSAPTVSVATIYTVTARNPTTGCARTLTTSVTSNTAVPTLSITNSPTITCSSPTVVITGTTTTSGATYSWSPGTYTTSSISVSSPNTYTLRVIGSNGCVSTGTVAVTSNTAVPTLSITNSPTITCSSPTVVITGTTTTSGATYSWSPGTYTTSSISVSSPNTYTLRVIGSNGCVSTGTVAIATNTTAPTLTVAPNTPSITCTNTAVAITNTNTASSPGYTWSPGGANTSSISVSAGGTYTLLVRDGANGCTISRTTVIGTNVTTPTVSAGSNQTITPSSPTVTLSGSSTTSGATFSWAPTTSSPTSSVTTTSARGIYTLTVTDPSNGCKNTSTVQVIANLSSIASITDYKNDTLKGAVGLLITGGSQPYNIAWNGIKFPSTQLIYNQFASASTGYMVDSVFFKSKIDTIKKITVLQNLDPGTYTVSIYDQVNDSIMFVNTVGAPVNTASVSGASTSTCSSAIRRVGNIQYNYGTGFCITQSGTYMPHSHYFIASNHVELSSPSSVSFNVPNSTDTLFIGLRPDSTDFNGYTSDLNANTMFKFNGNGTFNVVFNASSVYTGTMSAGDDFAMRVNPQTGRIAYYRNEALLIDEDYSVLNSSKGFTPKIVLGKSGASVASLKFTFQTLYLVPKITAEITDVSCDNMCGGAIKTSGYYPIRSYPVKYELYDQANLTTPLATLIPSGANNVTFQTLCAGKYSIKYYYTTILGGSGSFSQAFEVAYKPNWTNKYNSTVSPYDYTLVKTSGTQGAEDAGASSANSLITSTDGWVEWTAPANYAFNYVGLSHTDPDRYSSSITYKALIWRLFFFTDIHIYLTPNATSGQGMGTFSNTSKFRLQKTGTVLNFLIDNQQVATYGSITSQSYLVDATLKTLSGDINHPRCSFGCQGSVVYAVPKETLDGTFYSTYSKKLYLKYDERYIDESLKFNIYDASRNLVNTSGMSTILKKYGNNWLTLDFSSLSGISMNAYYVLELYNEKGQKEYVRFFTN